MLAHRLQYASFFSDPATEHLTPDFFIAEIVGSTEVVSRLLFLEGMIRPDKKCLVGTCCQFRLSDQAFPGTPERRMTFDLGTQSQSDSEVKNLS